MKGQIIKIHWIELYHHITYWGIVLQELENEKVDAFCFENGAMYHNLPRGERDEQQPNQRYFTL